jgi:hypothetical protein
MSISVHMGVAMSLPMPLSFSKRMVDIVTRPKRRVQTVTLPMYRRKGQRMCMRVSMSIDADSRLRGGVRAEGVLRESDGLGWRRDVLFERVRICLRLQLSVCMGMREGVGKRREG